MEAMSLQGSKGVAKQRYQPGKAAIHAPALEAHLRTHEVPGAPRRPAGLELLHERKWKSFSRVWLFVTSWSIQSMGSPGQNTGVGSCSILQGIFPTQGLNPGLPNCRQILYQLSHQGSPRILEWVAYPFSRGSSQPRTQTRVSCIAGEFFTSWATRESPVKHRNEGTLGSWEQLARPGAPWTQTQLDRIC